MAVELTGTKGLLAPTQTPDLMVCGVLLLVGLRKHVVCYYIGCESDNGDAESREDVPEHCCIREDWVFSPRLAFCPRITIKRLLRHSAHYKEERLGT